MFIKKLGLKNFKCFKEVEVNFSRITLLTGENSSGKSSLTYGLLAPFQSEGFPLYLFSNGKYVNMGDFQEISFKNLKNNRMKIHINLDNNHYLEGNHDLFTEWEFNPINKLPQIYYLHQESICNGIEPYKFEIKYCDDNYYLCSYYQKGFNCNFQDFQLNSLDEIPRMTDITSFEKTRNISVISSVSSQFDDILNDSLNFIGSYRLYPERTYYQKPKSSSQLLPSGEGFIDQILEWQEKKSEEFKDLISILKDLKLLYDIKPQKLGGGRFDLRVKVKRSSNWASLADVGFGVSQLLPIIVADLQLANNSTLIMAQPETHLHPSIQAELGTYLVKQIYQTEKQYIVETHSEYLINRLRLSIVKGEIEPEDVAVYYFENTVKEGSIAHQIQFTKQGQILNAPQGFFDTYMIDTMDIALNA